MVSSRTPGQRAGLTRQAVLAAARDLLEDGVGLDGLTMRALGRRLGVAPNALYSHVESRTSLLDALLDDLLSQVEVPPPGADPVEGLRALMTSTYDVLTAHPDLVPQYLVRQGARGPHAVRLGQVMDALLADAGVGPADAAAARRVLIVHALGSAAFAVGAPDEPDADRRLSQEQVRGTFTRSLHWLLAGIVQSG